ncbi:hypothetical protein BDP27DRAFT_1368220 [Rhodocollybia butyracea]|uniref:Uncharacterized protein n=1 Tax=Rhodocollybia butyracea TaxID=206335 RepID=A0A9P5U2Z7_9AGAR|nr:hypothetical protein BDP27DRAFT_1368220 [Rhodocollybia butyracea]
MPVHKPKSRSYSLNDLVLAMAFVEFMLSMAAAVLMRYHNGTVNDIICVFGIAAVVPGLLHAYLWGLEENKKAAARDVRWATKSSGNPSSAQMSVPGPIDGVAARNKKDGQANVHQGANLLATTNTNTPSTHKHSTYSLASLSASNESPVSSQIEKSRAGSQNQKLIRYTKGDGVEMDMKQFAALTQENMETNTVPFTSYLRSTIVSPPLDASLPAEVKGKNEELVAIRPAIVGTGVGTDIRGHPSSSMKRIAAGPTRTGFNTFADVSLPDNHEANQKLHLTTKEGDAAGIQEFVEAPQGELENVPVGSRRYEVTHPLTKTNMDKIGDSSSPIVNDNASATNAISVIHVASSTLFGAPAPFLQTEVSRVIDKGIRPNTEGDGKAGAHGSNKL